MLSAHSIVDATIDPSFVRDAGAWACSRDLIDSVHDPRQSQLRISYEDHPLPDDPDPANDVMPVQELLISIGNQDALLDCSEESPVLDVEDSLMNAAVANTEQLMGNQSTSKLRHNAEWWTTRCATVGDGSTESCESIEGVGSSGDGVTTADGTGCVSAESMCQTAGDDRKRKEEEAVAERRRKARARRERNRIAARKSNMKRKAVRDCLIAELESSKGIVVSLREKEILLRQENLRLRKLVTGND